MAICYALPKIIADLTAQQTIHHYQLHTQDFLIRQLLEPCINGNCKSKQFSTDCT